MGRWSASVRARRRGCTTNCCDRLSFMRVGGVDMMPARAKDVSSNAELHRDMPVACKVHRLVGADRVMPEKGATSWACTACCARHSMPCHGAVVGWQTVTRLISRRELPNGEV